jgi:pyruvate kinase
MSYARLPQDVKKGEIILVDDGKLKLEVLETNMVDTVTLKILNGGILSSKKGVNFPNTKISQPSLTKKDLEDLHFSLTQDIDFIALSFVRSAKDIVEIKKIIAKSKKDIKVIAKIEKPEAVDNFEEIVKVTDCVMVARGDLGVETPFDQVPVLQKELVHSCIQHAKPVIIATQMMESMITNFRPTRAEATDVANAVLDGADAVMLSGETSVGNYPLETIINMQKVITATETSGFYLSHDFRPNKNDPNFLHDSICFYACEMADHTKAAGILDFTFTGTSAVKIASYRPDCKIFAFGDDELVIRQLSLVRGVKAFSTQRHDNIHDATKYAFEILKAGKFVRTGDRLIIVGGIPLKNREHVNMIKVAIV